MVSPATCNNKDTLMRLWLHESLRVFHDRLICSEDRQLFTNLLAELVSKHFNSSASHADLFENRTLLFGDFLKPGLEREERLYEELPDMAKVVGVLEEHLEEYNMSATNPMSLVFFADAVEHVVRIARILRQPRGNAMLVGIGGSGKQSLTQFAAYMAGCKCC